MTDNTIIFRKGESSGLIIEKGNFDKSIFFDQYKQVFQIIDEILTGSSYDENLDITKNKVSNIVSFCGDRGEGKTSALMTVRNILQDNTILNTAKESGVLTYSNEHSINKNSFKVIKPIDPAFFDDKHNLIELLLGQMYADLIYNKDNAICGTNDGNCGEDHKEYSYSKIQLRNKLAQKFQDVRGSLTKLRKASNDSAYDKLEEIDDLAAASVLKEKIHNLLHCYAEYFGKERVLICIDDLDLNITGGYTMAEEIRKYLSTPDVCIILVAVKVDQLIDIAKAYYRNATHNELTDEKLEDMAERYVAKLLPQAHRITMPKTTKIVERPLILVDNNSNIPIEQIEKSKKEIFNSVKDAVVQLIYRKTRYIFVNGRSLCPIVPTNLRELRHLIELLWELKDISKGDEDHLKNKSVFKSYFYNSWVARLSSKDKIFVKTLVNNEDFVSINKMVVQHIQDTLTTKDLIIEPTDISDDEKLLRRIVNYRNTIQNVSVGDVFYLINYVDTITTDINTKNLLFFIKSYYSIMLYELYDVISLSSNALYPVGNEKQPSIYKYDAEYQKMNALQRFVNGSYFSYIPGKLLPMENENKNPRDKRVIDGVALQKVFKQISPNEKDKDNKRFKLCEFFALTVTHPILQSQYKVQIYDFDRTKTTRSYFDKFNINNKLLVFDALSIFYNMINIKFTYGRWDDIYGGDFYRDALENPESLLRQMLNAVMKHALDEKRTNKTQEEAFNFGEEKAIEEALHFLISDAIVRFSDVQMAIYDNLISNRNTKKEGGNAKNLQQLYRRIQNMQIRLYPLKGEKEDHAYVLPFNFLTPIIKLLTVISSEDITQPDSTIIQIAEDFETIYKTNFEGSVKDAILTISLLLSGHTFPSTGGIIRNTIKKKHPEYYKACGGAKFWNKFIVLDKEYKDAIEVATAIFYQAKARAIIIQEAINAKIID